MISRHRAAKVAKHLPYPGSPSIIEGMNQVLHLFQLQKIDSQLDQISHRLKEIQTILNSDKTLQDAENALAQARQEHYQTHQTLRAIEEKAQSHRIKMETSEAALYGGKIRNPKELQDLQNEIASLKRLIGQLEDQQLEAMVTLETAEASKKAAEENLIQTQSALATRQAGLLGEKHQHERQQEILSTERNACMTQITSESLAIYHKLREQKRGLAISLIEDGACKACGSSLRPAELQSARSPHNIVFCSSCGRIVYAG